MISPSHQLKQIVEWPSRSFAPTLEGTMACSSFNLACASEPPLGSRVDGLCHVYLMPRVDGPPRVALEYCFDPHHGFIVPFLLS